MNEQNEQQKKEKRRRRLLLLLLLLLIFAVAVTELVLLRRLGSLKEADTGRMIDTIVLSPEQREAETLSVCGMVCESDGAPVSGISVELHSNVKTTVTDAAGDFYFAAVEEGEHTITIYDENGKELLQKVVTISFGDTSELTYSEQNGEWIFGVPYSTLVLELKLTMDAGRETLSVDTESLSAILSPGRFCDSAGQVFTAQDGAILTAHGSVILTDGTVLLHQGGVLIPDEGYVSPQGEVYKSDEMTETASLPEGYVLSEDRSILTTPDGTSIYLSEGRAVLPDGTELSENRIVLTDGTVADHGAEEIVLPDGSVIRADNWDGEPIVSSGKQIELPNHEKGYRIQKDSLTVLDAEAEDTPTQTETPEPTQTPVPTAATSAPTRAPVSTSTPAPTAKPTPTPAKSVSVIDSATGTAWTQLTTIDLFYNCEELYPGVSGRYDFEIQNGIEGKSFFRMIIEEAEHKAGAIPLEYRLLDGNGYVTGEEWLSAEELDDISVTLNQNGSINYRLEWRWPYESGDTEAEIAENDREDTVLGSSDDLIHKITVTIHVESAN